MIRRFKKLLIGIFVLSMHLAAGGSLFAAASGSSSNGSDSFEPVDERETFCEAEIIAYRKARAELDAAEHFFRECLRTEASNRCDWAAPIRARQKLDKADQALSECLAYFYWLEEN